MKLKDWVLGSAYTGVLLVSGGVAGYFLKPVIDNLRLMNSFTTTEKGVDLKEFERVFKESPRGYPFDVEEFDYFQTEGRFVFRGRVNGDYWTVSSYTLEQTPEEKEKGLAKKTRVYVQADTHFVGVDAKRD